MEFMYNIQESFSKHSSFKVNKTEINQIKALTILLYEWNKLQKYKKQFSRYSDREFNNFIEKKLEYYKDFE